MAKSSFGPRRGENSWAATRVPKARSQIVRLGRPANDNFRPPRSRAWVLAAGLAGALIALMFANWRFF